MINSSYSESVHIFKDGLFSKVEHVLAVSLHTLILFLGADNNLIELTQTSTGRDEVTADNVLLHTLEEVLLTAYGGLVELSITIYVEIRIQLQVLEVQAKSAVKAFRTRDVLTFE